MAKAASPGSNPVPNSGTTQAQNNVNTPAPVTPAPAPAVAAPGTKPIYSKPMLTIAQSIQLLQTRGMIINDVPKAEDFLTNVGYYRLAGFWWNFQADPILHTFHPNVRFEDVIDLYDFDRQLRFIVYDSIERIEIALRSLLINEMSVSYGDRWFVDKNLFVNERQFAMSLKAIETEVERSNEKFIKEHKSKYHNDYFPPAMKTLQLLSFGTLSKLFSNIQNLQEKRNITTHFGLPHYRFLESWLQSIAVCRNLCAHHARITYISFKIIPSRMHTAPDAWVANLPATNHQQLLYNQLLAIRYMMNHISPGNTLTTKIQNLFLSYPIVNPVKLGFNAGWDAEPVWR